MSASIPLLGSGEGDGNAGGLPRPLVSEASPSVSFRTLQSLRKKSATRGLDCPSLSKSAGDPPMAVCIALMISGSEAASIIMDIACGLFCNLDMTSSGLRGSIVRATGEGAEDTILRLFASSKIRLLPTLLVMTRMQFLKLTVRPFPSVNIPSSIICKRIFSTSLCPFSSSSSRTTEWGFLLTASVSCPPSSYPTYPGGGPVSLLTLCFSMYSDMSMRTISFSLPKYVSARVLHSSVFPTPVGPQNMKLATGREVSRNPDLARLTALDTALTARV
mmetsp:Transcript_11597/g.17390  ORF Transcript_11597/g.17390 Transcript_11597/m.17390 type:complete len:275 (-) Transcript_11597:1346-2170(-)